MNKINTIYNQPIGYRTYTLTIQIMCNVDFDLLSIVTSLKIS